MKNLSDTLRPPIVAVLGHVDHGKTTLLDKIRSTNIQLREAGGITQSIGASVIKTKEGKDITFIDTPGHAAFSNMRKQGVLACDIAILVVSQDDGVKPQTIEALTFIKEENIPFIIALTKGDLPSADIERALGQLEKEGVSLEGRGGDVPFVPLSARSGQGVEKLTETISLLSEIVEVGKDASGDLKAVVIETSKTKAGLLVSVVIKDGEISVGQVVFSEDLSCKARGLFDYLGRPIKKISAGYPVQIIGFDTLPQVGAIVSSKENLKKTDDMLLEKKEYKAKLNDDEIVVIIKASTSGALEAIVKGVPKSIAVVDSGVGDVSENDVLTAKASKAEIFIFEVKVPVGVAKLAKTEGVNIFEFKIIYKLFEKMEEIISEGAPKELGKGEIIAEFPFNHKRVAGVRITSGLISKNDKVIIVRNEKEIGTSKVSSIKKGKQDVQSAKASEECGIIMEPQVDFRITDKITSVK